MNTRRFALSLLPALLPSLAAQTFTDRTAFLAAGGGGTPLLASFSGSNGTPVPSLFGGLVTFPSPVPTIFPGAWGAGCGTLAFSGGALIPQPRFQSRSVIMPFREPVFSVGAQVFDDYDGAPYVSTITLTVTTTEGGVIAVSESCNLTGDVGFLGIAAPQGITRAVFSIAGSGGNLEIDNLAVFELNAASATPYGSGCGGSLGAPSLSATALPYLGLPFVVQVANAPSYAVFGWGTSNTTWLGTPLPISGSAFGAPGCSILVAMEALQFAQAVGGTATGGFQVPLSPGLVGAVLHGQSLVLDPGTNSMGVVSSNALVCVLGN